MENMNLLDLNNDILNIIGDYVCADNDERDEVKKNSIKLFKIIKNTRFDKKDTRNLIINYFYVNNIQDIETIDLYLTLMKMNLKRKKYTFSTYCIKNLEDSKKTYDEILEKETLFYFNKRYGRDYNNLCLEYVAKFLFNHFSIY